ncbi:hypothetical protein NW762_013394 [Fusarium torreyae]|uniref:GPI inositol-deacylase winged helix domain-containing protein n=1 Tax=Fusarium torreyae TaxID=1237075 RepID=A0A9W8RNP9_9HYPO|nr:hypothetical protein NW762_013394 [Fusarium torreyae]
MHELPAFVGRNKDLQKRIKDVIIDKVDGMFLLARLHLNSLIGQVTENGIIDELSALPDGYNEAYEKCMERIEGQIGNRKMLAKKLLSWITCAEVPLTVPELKHALAVRIDQPSLSEGDIPQEMVEVCAGLIKIEPESQVIRLVHYTTQEYFQREHERWFPNAQVDMILTCLTAGCTLNATDSWGRTPLLLAAEEGCDSTVRRLILERDIEINATGITKRTPLLCAARNGYDGVVEALLKHPSIEINARDKRGRTPLSLAAFDGHGAVVELLLKHPDVDVNIQNWGKHTPLSLVAYNGHDTIVSLMLKKRNINVNTRNRFGEIALGLAVRYGHKEVVGLLAPFNKIEIYCIDGEGRTALMLAVTQKNVSVIEELLDHQATWGAQDPDGRTALHLAVIGGNEEDASSLVSKEYRGNLEIRDAYGFTPLHLASRATEWLGETGVRIVKLLIKEGADDKTRTCLGLTAEEIEESVRRNSVARLQLVQTDPKHRSTPETTHKDDQERMSMLMEVKMGTWNLLFGRTRSRDSDVLKSTIYNVLNIEIETNSGGTHMAQTLT